jgi:hypothetical protein
MVNLLLIDEQALSTCICHFCGPNVFGAAREQTADDAMGRNGRRDLPAENLRRNRERALKG